MSNQNKSKKGKRGGRAARKTANLIRGVSSAATIFPPLFRGKQRYQGLFSLAPAANSPAINVFRWNSVYDPDFSGTGQTAQTYTQLSALYGRYRVMHAKMTVEFVNTAAVALSCFVVLSPATTLGTNIAQILGQRFIWTGGIGGAQGAATLKHTVSAPVGRIYGVPASQVRIEDDFAAVTGSNPNNGVFAHVGVYCPGGSSGAMTMHVTIDYDVVWSLPLETNA